METKTKNMLMVGACALILAATALYTIQATKAAILPFSDSKLSGLTYLATKISDCKECQVVQYYWDQEKGCDIHIVELTSTSDTINNPNTKVASLETQSLDQWLKEKGENKYAFSQENYQFFKQSCHTF